MYSKLYPMTYYFYPLLEDKISERKHRDVFFQSYKIHLIK